MSKPSTTPLCANSRSCCSKGWVLACVCAPVLAWRTCATNVVPVKFRAAVANAVLVPRCDRLLVDPWRPGCVEDPDAGAVRVAMALQSEAVRRVEQPERRRDRRCAGMQTEQPTHQLIRPDSGIGEVGALDKRPNPASRAALPWKPRYSPHFVCPRILPLRRGVNRREAPAVLLASDGRRTFVASTNLMSQEARS